MQQLLPFVQANNSSANTGNSQAAGSQNGTRISTDDSGSSFDRLLSDSVNEVKSSVVSEDSADVIQNTSNLLKETGFSDQLVSDFESVLSGFLAGTNGQTLSLNNSHLGDLLPQWQALSKQFSAEAKSLGVSLSQLYGDIESFIEQAGVDVGAFAHLFGQQLTPNGSLLGNIKSEDTDGSLVSQSSVASGLLNDSKGNRFAKGQGSSQTGLDVTNADKSLFSSIGQKGLAPEYGNQLTSSQQASSSQVSSYGNMSHVSDQQSSYQAANMSASPFNLVTEEGEKTESSLESEALLRLKEELALSKASSNPEGKGADILSIGDKLKSDLSSLSFKDVHLKAANAGDRLYSSTVSTNVFQPEWGDDISQKIVWLTSREIKSAEIHLNPAELGPIDVKVSVQNDTAAVTINAQNATVRELLESQVVRLREMMDQNGVELKDVNVGGGDQGSEGFSQNDKETGNGSGHIADSLEGENAQELVTETRLSSSNLVDYFV